MTNPRRGMTPERAARAANIVALYDQGHTFDKIAQKHGISQTQARKDYDQAMEEARPDTAIRVFHKLDRRLNELHATYWQMAVQGDLKAARFCLDVIKQSADLWGVNGAVKVEVETTGGEPFAELLAAIRGAGGTTDGDD